MNFSYILPQVLVASMSSQFFKELCLKFIGQAGELGANGFLDFVSRRPRSSHQHTGFYLPPQVAILALPQAHTYQCVIRTIAGLTEAQPSTYLFKCG